MSTSERIATEHLYRPITTELVALLRALPPADWLRRTSAGEWTVRDVAAHLLDVELRRLSAQRDGHAPAPAAPIESYAGLVAFLNGLNRAWTDAAQRLSTRVLTDLLAWTCAQVADVIESADPYGPALYPVAWAGQDASPMWLDHGRVYTEQWHHQDQIRAAVGAPPLAGPEWLRPVIEISLLALPRAYAPLEATPGTSVALDVDGPAGGHWAVVRDATGWRVVSRGAGDAAARLAIGDYALAKLLLHRLDADTARAAATVTGDAALAEPLLAARAVMV